MNTHDKIELPPLPDLPAYSSEVFDREVKVVSETMAEQLMHDYARAAIEPYQQRVTELESQLEAIGAGGVSSQRITSQRRGEPVGYIMPSALKQLKAGGHAVVGGVSQGFDVPIYAAPQPAEPVDKSENLQSTVVDKSPEMQSQPAEPAREPGNGERAAQGLPPYSPRHLTEEEWNRLTENGRKAWGKKPDEPEKEPPCET